jgi:hypothetical protein
MFCRNEWQKKRYAEDPDFRERKKSTNRKSRRKRRKEINERYRLRMESDPEYRQRKQTNKRKGLFENTYGITLADYALMVARQGGLCAICRTKPKKRLAVDHNHKTKQVRRLLCGHCNSMIGFGRDDPAILDEGAAYLREFSGDEGERAAATTRAALDFWAVSPSPSTWQSPVQRPQTEEKTARARERSSR